MMTLLVNARGIVRCVYTEDLDLAAIGALRIARASHVEPDQAGRWWVDITPAGGRVMGPFDRRSDALAAERQWLEENLSSVATAMGRDRPHPVSPYRSPITTQRRIRLPQAPRSRDMSRHIAVHIDERELATVLAALRFHQAENLQAGSAIPDEAISDIATDGGRLAALGSAEIDGLCDRINAGEASAVGVQVPKAEERPQVPDGIQRIHDILYLDTADGREFYEPDKEWDADTMAMVAEIVAEHIPRPQHNGKEGD